MRTSDGRGRLPEADAQTGDVELDVAPSRRPVPKVIAGTAAGAATVVLVWTVGLFGLTVPPEVAAAVTVLLTFGVAYLKR